MTFAIQLNRNARDWGLQTSETVEFAFRRRYSLPLTDPRYLDSTLEDVIVDYWAHQFCDDPKLKDEIVNPDFEEDLAEMERDLAAAAAAPEADWEPVVNDTYGDN